jgi:hypothetical protein
MKAMLDPKIVAARIHGAAFGVQADVASFERMTPRRRLSYHVSHWCVPPLLTLSIYQCGLRVPPT